MDAKRFDNWSRNCARKFTRRRAIATAGAAGLVSSLASHVSGQARYQFGGEITCRFAVQAETAIGPSGNTSFSGQLEITVAESGVIGSGLFTPAFGQSLPVAGWSSGRAIDLLITLPDQKTLALAGVAAEAIGRCAGPVAGLFSGPAPGDLGSWHAGNADSALGGAATCGSVSCGVGQVLDQATCQCFCQAGTQACGQTCCQAGSVCSDPASGACVCPAGTEFCGGQCTPACQQGQTKDPATCSCGTSCTPNGQGCLQGFECCTGFCPGTSGTCECPPGTEECQGNCVQDCPGGTIDLQSCLCIIPPTPVCKQPGDPCALNIDCCEASVICTDRTADAVKRRIICPVGAGGGTVCGEGVCGFLQVELAHCGACFNACTQGQKCENGQCVVI